MGKVFFDMGMLSQAKVEECSATDMIGQYVGQTGPKVQKLLEKAMGKVLFIDEAYRLADGGFATEAMDELVDCLTKPKFAGKLVTILAGYDKDIDRLLSMNPGLSSRFPESVNFNHLDPKTCLELLIKVLTDLQRKKKAPIDLSVLTKPNSTLKKRTLELFRDLSGFESWGNGRDVRSLARSMFGKLISTAVPPVTNLVLTESIVLELMENMLSERSRRNAAVGTSRFPGRQPLHPLPQPQQQKPPTAHEANIKTEAAPVPPQASPTTAIEIEKQKESVETAKKHSKPEEKPEDPIDSIFRAKRDSGVSDAIWEQLERDKHAMVAKEREYRRLQEEKRKEEERIQELIRAEKAAADEAERKLHEAKRVEAELERRRRQEALAAMEREREKERETQKKLQMLGRCPVGYQWIKQARGYRCAGGSHWLDEAALGMI